MKANKKKPPVIGEQPKVKSYSVSFTRDELILSKGNVMPLVFRQVLSSFRRHL